MCKEVYRTNIRTCPQFMFVSRDLSRANHGYTYVLTCGNDIVITSSKEVATELSHGTWKVFRIFHNGNLVYKPGESSQYISRQGEIDITAHFVERFDR